MTAKTKKKTRKSDMSLELVGGIYFVKKFKDGTERRDEIDGEAVLKLILQIVFDRAEKLLASDK